MAQRFKQLRFYNYNSNTTDNYPHVASDTDAKVKWCEGELFAPYLPITQLGIQAPPGTSFQVNGSDSYAIVGYTGLFEIDLSAGGEIVSLGFSPSSLDYIAGNPNASLIVDLIYEPQEG